MADYSTSVLATGQMMVAEEFQKPEMRHQPYNITGVLRKNAPYMYLPGELEKLSTSKSRTIEAYAYTKSATDAITAKSASHTASAFGDSQKVTVSFSTIGQEFKTGLAMADNNMTTYQGHFNNRYRSAWIHLMDTLETAGYTFMNTYKTQVRPAVDSALGTWDTSNYLWKVPQTDEEFFWQNISMVLSENDYDQAIDIINNMPGHAQAIRRMNQGTANSTNTSFQFENMMLHSSKNIAAFSGSQATSFVIPFATAGMATRNDNLNKSNTDTKVQTYTTVPDPFGLGLTADLHFYETRSDTSSNGGSTQDEVIQWELTLQYAINSAPLSTSNEYPIHKFALMA